MSDPCIYLGEKMGAIYQLLANKYGEEAVERASIEERKAIGPDGMLLNRPEEEIATAVELRLRHEGVE